MNIWLLTVILAVITWLERYLMLEYSTRIKLPMWLLRSLRFVPAALLTAIAVPGLFVQNGALQLNPLSGRVLAGLATVLVAWRSRNVVLSIGAGMAAAWLFAWLAG